MVYLAQAFILTLLNDISIGVLSKATKLERVHTDRFDNGLLNESFTIKIKLRVLLN